MATARKVDPGVDNNNQRLINVATPTSGTDAANKNYVDNAMIGLDWKVDCVASPTTNITISNPATSSFDGVTVTTGQRVLLMNQTAQAENGIYIFNGSSSAMTRSPDANTAALLESAVTSVEQGTVNGNSIWIQTSEIVTLGTTSVVWAKVNAGQVYTSGNGILVSGGTITAVAASGGGLSVVSGGIQLDTTIATRKYASTFGNGALQTFTITHNLGTQNVEVQIRDTTDNYRQVEMDVTAPTSNTVVINTAGTPTTGQYAVVVEA